MVGPPLAQRAVPRPLEARGRLTLRRRHVPVRRPGGQAPSDRGEVRGRRHPGRRGQDGWLAVRRRRLALRHPRRGGDQAPGRSRGGRAPTASPHLRGHLPLRRRRARTGARERGDARGRTRTVRHGGRHHPRGPVPLRPRRARRRAEPSRSERSPRPSSWNVGDDIPEGQSLFNVGRPDPVALSGAAIAAASDDPETILDADDEPEPEPTRAGPSGAPLAPTPTSTRRVSLRLVTRTATARSALDDHASRWGQPSVRTQ